MTAGIVGTLTADKTSYNEGDLITVTIVRHATSADTTHDAPAYGSLSAGTWVPVVLNKVTATVTVPGGPIDSSITGAITDTDGRTFIQVSDDGVTWIGTATA